MHYLRVKNLEKYQHYKTRTAPWIKLYHSLLDDPDFLALDEIQQGRYLKCLLIGHRTGNHFPDDPIYIQKMMRISDIPDVSPLKQAGFLLSSHKHYARKVLDKSPLKPSPSLSPLSSSSPDVQKKRKIQEVFTERFLEFWDFYPTRNGKKLEKRVTAAVFMKLSDVDQLLCVQAVQHYANSARVKENIGIKDPKRFLKDDYWREFIEAERPTEPRSLFRDHMRQIVRGK